MGLIGYDYLGAGHKKWPLRKSIRLTPAGSAIGCFWDTFGPAKRAISRFANSGKFPVIRIHVWWSNQHAIVPPMPLAKACREIEKLAKAHPLVKFYISHSCEHNETNEQTVRSRMKVIRDEAPSCIPVNSVWQGALLDDEINEKHGADGECPGVYINSFDGESCYDQDVNKWHKKHADSLIRFLWAARFNGREVYKEGDTVPPPLLRTAWPDRKYLKSVIALQAPSGALPAIPGAIPIEKPLLYKTHSEDHPGDSNARENKPVLILPVEANKAQITTLAGQSICEFNYGGGFAGGGNPTGGLPGMHRYYSPGMYGYEIAEKATMKSGSPWALVKVKAKTYGPIHPAYREGYYQ